MPTAPPDRARTRRRRRVPFALIIATLVVAGSVIVIARHGRATEAVRPLDALATQPPTLSSSPTARPSASPQASSAIPTPSPSPTNVWAAISDPTLSPVVAGDRPLVYVPNGKPGTLEEIDPTTFKIVRRYSFGAGSFPEHVSPSWDMRWLYVTVDASSTLAVIDPKTGRWVRTIHGVDHPYNMYFTPDGSKAIDVAEYYDQLRFMDPRTFKLIKALPMPCNGPDHMDFSATGTYLMVGCEFDGRVIKVDWATMKVLGTVHVGGLPVDVKLSPDGSVFYVANQGRGGVSVVDPVAMKVVKFIRTGRGAHGFAVSRNTQDLYLTNRLAGSISVISFAERRVIDTWFVGGTPDMVQVSPDGKQLWETNRYGTTVTVVDTSNGHIIKQIQVGIDPHGLSYFPQPGRYSLGHNGVYR